MEIELKNDASSSKALKLMITEHIKYLQGLRSIQVSVKYSHLTLTTEYVVDFFSDGWCNSALSH